MLGSCSPYGASLAGFGATISGWRHRLRGPGKLGSSETLSSSNLEVPDCTESTYCNVWQETVVTGDR